MASATPIAETNSFQPKSLEALLTETLDPASRMVTVSVAKDGHVKIVAWDLPTNGDRSTLELSPAAVTALLRTISTQRRTKKAAVALLSDFDGATPG